MRATIEEPRDDTGARRDAAPAAEGWRRNLRGDEPLTAPRGDGWWTGPRPDRGARIRGLPLPDLSRATRDDLLAYFDDGWLTTETLFAGLVGEEAFYRPPWHHLRHPMVFYYAHPAALYVNKLRVAGLRDGPVNASFEQLFETGVDEMSWDDLSKNDMEWPRVSEVTEYRRAVHALVRGVLESHPDAAPGRITMDHPLWAVVLGMEHERIHIETSSVLIRELPAELVRRPDGWPDLHPALRAASPGVPPAERPLRWVDVAGGDATVGKPRAFPTFGWDNEYGRRVVRVAPFAATGELVTNGQFHPFVASGAFADPRWWTEDGWKWRTFRNAKRPTFWVPSGPAGLHEYRLRTVFEVVDMPWDAPVCVNHHEAKAFAAWRASEDRAASPYRLLTEGEHHRIRGASGGTGDANLALRWSGESPVDALPANDAGFRDAFGNVWQWAEDHFAALPGFRVHPYYDDFSTPCFDGEHNLILGGSWASLGDEAGVHARFHFRRHFHQHAGFRLVRASDPSAVLETTCLDAPPPHVGSGPCCSRDASRAKRSESGYEAARMRDAYLLLHFGTADDVLGAAPGPRDAAEFPRRCGALVRDWADRVGAGDARALDVGCAVGGAAFDLARRFRSVVGFDLSASFVAAANTLRESGELTYSRVEEGDLVTPRTARVDAAVDRSRTSFRRGDACALPADLGAFDAVLVANLLCRLPSPRSLLGRLGGPRGLVRPGGVLVITTPSTWREEFTPRDAWLGGYEKDGRPVRTIDGLRHELDADFELLETRDLPFLIREHARKWEYVVAQASVWRRR